ncbi:aftiphilin-like isoform X3 [Pecten maximus]|uniref:aftiphilin-like isoform X3 n=1 Tax=Pecten maximus TaxID=6579 RepID=UPI0014583EF2|nr:aftiphilin-like isoform X3 [Pecten maximus]
MSNFIPMVSSSPPPLEDGGGGFNEWDDEDDEFGTFATATVGNDFQAFSDEQSSADQWNNIPDTPPKSDFGKFADFSNFSSDSKIECMQNGDMIPEVVNNNTQSNDSKEGSADNCIKPGGMKLPLKTANDFVNSENIQEIPAVHSNDSNDHLSKMHKSQSDNLDSISSVISAGDSGLCSTDISPVPQSDDNVGLEDKSEESDLDDFGDFHSDSSMGREVLKGSIENIDVIEKQGGIGEMVNAENVEDKCKSTNSDNLVSNMMTGKSVNDQEIRTSHLNEDNMCESEQGTHDQVSPASHYENTKQYTSLSTSSTDTSKNYHSEKEESLPYTEDRKDSRPGQSKNETLTSDGDCCPDVNETSHFPDTKDGNSEAEENTVVDVDVGETCLDVDPNTMEDTPSVEDQGNTDNCGDIVSDKVKEHGHNDIASESSDLIRTGSTIKAVSDLEIGENQESIEENLKHSDSAAFDEADEHSETFRKVGDSETDCGFTEQSQEMKDSGFVFTDLSSSEEENSEKKEEETEAKLEENCDISKQTVDKNEEFVIDNEDFCEDSVSPGRKDEQDTENDNTKPEPPPVLCSDDEFDDFADFHSVSQFSVQDQSLTKSGDDSVSNRSTPKVDENKSVDKDDEDGAEFDDFADFHSGKPTENDVSESLPQTISNSNEKSSSDFNSGNCNDDDVDDDFDSFADFSSHFTSESSKNNSGTSTVLTDEVKSGSDGFNAFSSASAADGDNEEEDDWATFQAPPTPDQVGAGSNDDDFGEFEDFEHAVKPKGFSTSSSAGNFAAFKEPEPAVTKPVVKQTFCEVITSCFPESVVMDQEGTDNTPLLLDDCCHRDATPDDKSVTGPQIWGKLKSPNSTIQLSKLWSESHSNTKLFTTLRIDTRNILLGHRKPSVPMYAANLTLLEPTKGPTPPSEGKPDANKLVDTSKVDDKPASQDLPPVQFDWSNSGLTNPLEANSKSLELDFLVVKEAEAVAKMGDEWDWVFDSELMHGQRDPKAAMQPLENILANLKTNSTMRQVRPAENLTPEATKVITSLPNLSFMKARALMFPFKQSSDAA